MWWLERAIRGRPAGLAAAVGASAALAGCFQPLYGSQSFTSSPGVASAMAAVDVSQVPAPTGSPEARVAVALRNDVIFDLTGGGAPAAQPIYRLVMTMHSDRVQVIVDTTTGRPEVQNYGIAVHYTLMEIKGGKTVLTSNAFSRVSYDVPGEAQRFAKSRGQIDAENRSAKEMADMIRARLASFFVAGT